MADPNDRLLALAVSPTTVKRDHLMISFNRGMSADEMNRLHEHLLRFGIRIEGPYRVIVDKAPCQQCEKGGMYTIVVLEDGGEVGIGTSWGDREWTQDICDLMNMAYDFGKEAQRALADDVDVDAVNAQARENARSIDEDVQSAMDAERGG